MFDQLPIEVLSLIFRQLPLDDVVLLSRTNRVLYRKAGKNAPYWKIRANKSGSPTECLGSLIREDVESFVQAQRNPTGLIPIVAPDLEIFSVLRFGDVSCVVARMFKVRSSMTWEVRDLSEQDHVIAHKLGFKTLA